MTRHALALVAVLAIGAQGFAQSGGLLGGFTFRSLGPAAMGGRIVDLEGSAKQPGLLYAASASGGVWKSTNYATTWTPVTDGIPVFSVGDVAVAPSNPDTVWVGAGEHNNQRSAHYGDGVYKSIDAGRTWTNMGLKASLHIGRIAISAKNPDVVYVAVIGPLYKEGGMRGVYKTADGGKTWTQSLKGDNATTGFIDIVIDPKNPDVVYAAAYDRLRRAWNIRESGPGSAIYKSSNGGKTWTKLAAGFPTGNLGRIGLAIFPEDPKIVYAVVENRNGRSEEGFTAEQIFEMDGEELEAFATVQRAAGTEVYKTTDGAATWKKVNETRIDTSYYYAQIRVDPKNSDVVYNLAVPLHQSTDGGKTWKSIGQRMHVDHHSLWIDPSNTEHVFVGNDGGLYQSFDRGATWKFLDNLPIGQFYAIGADNAVPYNIFGGLQDNGVWHGPSATVSGEISNKDWRSIYGGDGFYTLADPDDPNTVYTSSQFGGFGVVDIKTGRSRSARPRSQGLRANWMAPFLVSPHNSKTLYWGANKVFKSVDATATWVEISGDLTTNNAEKLKGNVPHCTITTMSESPRKAGVLWVGTDDGNVWVTEDDGKKWSQADIPGAPKEFWVSRVYASPHEAGTAFASFTGFREEDFKPYLFKTTDFGKTWTTLVGNLPDQQIAVVWQDTQNENLIFVGTEAGLHVSLDGGKTYSRFMNGLPMATPVQDLVIHERESDLIIGTHGRGIYIADIAPLRQLTSRVQEAKVHLFQPDGILLGARAGSMFDAFKGSGDWAAVNPTPAPIAYFLKESAAGPVSIEILGADGEVLQKIDGKREAGIHYVNWNMRRASSGTFGVRLTVDGEAFTRNLTVVDW
ncbi:MAG: hypothetical protein M3R13_09910 [Armatimonadota bacterium]|nr:hypothetical protein [Armatimonadota bacterium]